MPAAVSVLPQPRVQVWECEDAMAETCRYLLSEDNVDYNDPAEYGIVPIRGGSRARAASLARSSPNPSQDGDGDKARSNGRGGGANVAQQGMAGLSGRSAAGARGGGRGGNDGGRAGGRGGRIGRGLSEAAAALLDMGFVDDDGGEVCFGSYPIGNTFLG